MFDNMRLRPALGVIIRFKNSATTLPAVLAALRQQTIQPDIILGIDNQSSDGSADLIRAAGGVVIEWTQPYHHSRVLNFALRHCPADLVLVLSSHTVLKSPEALAELVSAMADWRTACASGKWDDDPFYSDAIEWPELAAKGLKFCSIYTNSVGIIRRALWEQAPFDESLPTMEDAAWAVEQLKRGYNCRRVPVNFAYQRKGKPRHFQIAVFTFQLAARHGLKVAWLGVGATIRQLLGAAARWKPASSHLDCEDFRGVRQRLCAWAAWRFVHPATE